MCNLIRNSERYDKIIVRTQALLNVNHENQFIYNPECETGSTDTVWVDFDPSYIYSDEKLRRKLTDLLRPKPSAPTGTAWVTIVGRFEGANGGPYGHLDAYRSRFLIIRLEQAEEVVFTSRVHY